jgi:hypothetical protein
MLKTAAALAVLLAVPVQEKNANPDLLYKKDLGVSISKPPKNEEWDFKDKGYFSNSQLIVSHRVDTLTIEIFHQDKAGGFSYYDPKDGPANMWKSISGDTNNKDAKKVGEPKTAKLPGNGAGGVMTHTGDITYTRDGKKYELKSWCFIGKENQNLYNVVLIAEEGMYKKHQKFADFCLASIRTWKLPK